MPLRFRPFAPAPFFLVPLALAWAIAASSRGAEKEQLFADPLDLDIPHITADSSVRYDYDLVYVRAPRRGDQGRTFWTEIAHPWLMDAGADLMLLHPDGTEQVLVTGGKGSITDPVVSFDGQSVYYCQIYDLTKPDAFSLGKAGADIYKMHVPTGKITRLTDQTFTPNLGAAAAWTSDLRSPGKPGETYFDYGVYNMGPCPLPGGRLMFVSNRNGFSPPKHPGGTLQLFVMDEAGTNLELVGYLNIGMALHPTVLKDGRVVFSSLESQGLRSSILWGLWSINPDGTRWAPVLSAFDPGSAPNAFHFQTQLSDGSIIAEEYYNQNNSGFGAYFKLPPNPPAGYAGFGPAYRNDPRNPALRFGRFDNARPKTYRLPFSPTGAESFTRFANNGEGPADPSRPSDQHSPAAGKFTHPAAAPDNHLLTVWSPGPVNHQYTHLPMPDGGIYLIKSGLPIDDPAQMRAIKNDPNYNEQWPRALVPYRRIYGVDEPAALAPLANDGSLSPHLPAGTPFGLIGTSSLYKRETFPDGVVPEGKVTAQFAGPRDPTGYGGLDPFNTSENGATLNWFNQGADAGRYSNDDIHAIRILVMEPTTDRRRGSYPRDGRLFYSHAQERLRILGEIPVRKLNRQTSGQPLDPDGNPDTSFLARIPADTAFTFQTLDKDGMVLNMAQTWHQLRPGEIRHDCGGCHAHSQQPTLFDETAAAKPDYPLFDLTQRTPLVTTRDKDESHQQWDTEGQTGLRFAAGVQNVEYFRDIQPILERSCTACHTGQAQNVPGELVLDDAEPVGLPDTGIKVPGTYYRLALDHQEHARFGYKPVIHNGSWRNQNASRYIRKFQSRRSLLVWKVLGRRTDGWTNDDFPSEAAPGDPNTLQLKGEPVAGTHQNRDRADLDYNGHEMPPAAAVAGTYQDSGGKLIKVEPLSDEDRRTIIRWIDLGCPIDLDFQADRQDERSARRGYGWMCDDNRPTLALALPRAGRNEPLQRILVGMHDYYSGLDPESFTVVADFPIPGTPAGENLAARFQPAAAGIWELKLAQPLDKLERGLLTVSVKDRQGNLTRIERTFSVGSK